jgi:hypothetical protein
VEKNKESGSLYKVFPDSKQKMTGKTLILFPFQNKFQ